MDFPFFSSSSGLPATFFNILGAVLQGVLPTMIILAVYYTLADIVLLAQCFYYRGFTLSDDVKPLQQRDGQSLGNGQAREEDTQAADASGRSEQTPLLVEGTPEPHPRPMKGQQPPTVRRESLASLSSFRDNAHLSPAMPIIESVKPFSPPPSIPRPTSTYQKIILNAFAIALVCTAGVLGWYVSMRSTARSRQHHDRKRPDDLSLDVLGQIFGYLCAALYLGSRIPQLLLNWRRRSTEGVSLLFFLFACIGNLTYVLSIFAYSPVCDDRGGRCRPGEHEKIYARYLLVNASWLLGSLGTLFLDLAIFAQFIMYREKGVYEDDGEEAVLEQAR